MPPPLSPDAIEAAIAGRFGRPCRYLASVGSTNVEALQWADDGADEGSIVTADHQTAGRGRRGRSWFDQPGSSILCSLILRPRIALDRLGLLPVALGTAIAEALAGRGIPGRTKWPNDVIVDGRKIAGILVETRLIGSSVDIAVAGFGINHDWSDAEMPAALSSTATSIRDQISDALPTREAMLAEVLVAIEDLYPLVLNEESVGKLLDRARSRSAVLDQEVAIRMTEGGLVSGVARDLMPDGGLQVEVEGEWRVLHVGEIEQLRPAREGSD